MHDWPSGLFTKPSLHLTSSILSKHPSLESPLELAGLSNGAADFDALVTVLY
jgi:hypothetical protein